MIKYKPRLFFYKACHWAIISHYKIESLSFGIVAIIRREEIKIKHAIYYIHNNLEAKTKLYVN